MRAGQSFQRITPCWVGSIEILCTHRDVLDIHFPRLADFVDFSFSSFLIEQGTLPEISSLLAPSVGLMEMPRWFPKDPFLATRNLSEHCFTPKVRSGLGGLIAKVLQYALIFQIQRGVDQLGPKNPVRFEQARATPLCSEAFLVDVPP